MPVNPFLDSIETLTTALVAAGLTVRYSSSPEAGPGVVIDIPDMEWENPYRTGCGDPSIATLSTNIWIVAHGHADDQRLAMEDKTYAVMLAMPRPWRVVRVNHDRSTPDQYVREIQIES